MPENCKHRFTSCEPQPLEKFPWKRNLIFPQLNRVEFSTFSLPPFLHFHKHFHYLISIPDFISLSAQNSRLNRNINSNLSCSNTFSWVVTMSASSYTIFFRFSDSSKLLHWYLSKLKSSAQFLPTARKQLERNDWSIFMAQDCVRFQLLSAKML